MAAGQSWRLRRILHGIDGRRTAIATAQMCLAAGLMAAVSYGVWAGLDELLGRAVLAQCASVGLALLAGGALYAFLVLLMRIPEAGQIRDLLAGRLRGRAA